MIKEIKNYITKEQCQELMISCDKFVESLTVLGSDNKDNYRVAEGTWFNKYNSKFSYLSDMIAETIGMPKENQEDIHLVKYLVGGEYRPHHDFFHLHQSYTDAQLSRGGQRTKSCLIYLNDDFEGGETEFTQVGIKIKPETGKLLIWDNCKEDGSLDYDSIHAGLPVKSGTKYIVIIWVRESKFE